MQKASGGASRYRIPKKRPAPDAKLSEADSILLKKAFRAMQRVFELSKPQRSWNERMDEWFDRICSQAPKGPTSYLLGLQLSVPEPKQPCKPFPPLLPVNWEVEARAALQTYKTERSIAHERKREREDEIMAEGRCLDWAEVTAKKLPRDPSRGSNQRWCSVFSHRG